MYYYTGLFDAEGSVSLCPNGKFRIAIEITNENIPIMFQSKFGGSIHRRKRDKRKVSWTWILSNSKSQCSEFIHQIGKLCLVKKAQLFSLLSYIDQTREQRRNTRRHYISLIKKHKTPSDKIIIFDQDWGSEANFIEWLAGFIDGDGNITCYESVDAKTGKQSFGHQISASNTFKNVIYLINRFFPGTIIHRRKKTNDIFTWVCFRKHEENLVNKLIPYLRIKKRQAECFLKFISFPPKKRGVDLPISQRREMCDLIQEIRHFNSL